MSQPPITLTAAGTTLTLDPDLQWKDEFAWFAVEQTAARSLTGALLIDQGARVKGRPITLAPDANDAAWMPRATLAQLQAWEATPGRVMTLDLRGVLYNVQFRRWDGPPVDAQPVVFVADPAAGGFGDFYLVTLRFVEV